MAKVLIIDDDDKIRTLLSRILSLEGFEILQSSNTESALKKFEHHDIDVAICDVKMPDGNGVQLCRTIKTKYPAVEVILLTAYGNIPDGVQSIKNGAFDYITKGDDNDKIIPLLHSAVAKVALTKKGLKGAKEDGKKYSFESIKGKSKILAAAVDIAKKVAATDATVLLTGETGTGKEVFAQAIHNEGSRSKQNFIAINCSAFSKELLENELFGHKAGAFTGATKDSKGIFEEADRGTVFLDEIGEMPLALQAKLLRVLETGEFLKVGDSKVTKVNVRIIAATNRDLQNEISAGNFREDLYFRIAVFQIELPPLRDRVNDIEILATFFLHSIAEKAEKNIVSFSEDYFNALKLHSWKGNIRELKNVIERSVILTSGTELQTDSLPAEMQKHVSGMGVKKYMSAFEMSSAEKIHIQKVLNYTSGNKTETARLLNIALTTLYRKLEEYKIK